MTDILKKQGELLKPETFHEALSAQLNVTERLNAPCAMLLLRMEFEEIYAEQYEVHDLGGLRTSFARVVDNMVRDTDTVGWLEDGCLAVLLRAISAEDTTLVATRLQKQLARQPILFGRYNLFMAVQIGGVWTSGDHPMPIDDFTEQAWVAMLS